MIALAMLLGGLSCGDSRPGSTATTPRWTAVGAGKYFSCGLDVDGAVECWGEPRLIDIDRSFDGATRLVVTGELAAAWNDEGEFEFLYDEPFEYRFREHETGVDSIGFGTARCARMLDGLIDCAPNSVADMLYRDGDAWGPIPASFGGLVECFLDDAGGLACFDGRWPLDYEPEGPFERVACMAFECCAMDSHGGMRCGFRRWGNWGFDCRVGMPSCIVEYDAGPWVDFDGNYADFCALTAAGRAQCWLDESMWDVVDVLSPPADKVFVDIDVGDGHACGLDAAGDITCWGDDTRGQSSPPE